VVIDTGHGHGKEVVPMCYEFDSQFFRARALEALRGKSRVADELNEPAAPAHPATAEPAASTQQPDSVPA
jgi:hypothetical protein